MKKEGILGTTPIILDPVTKAKNGQSLINDEEEASIVATFKDLFPLTTIITPNIHEASQLLGGRSIRNADEMESAAYDLLKCGSNAVIIKGGALAEDSLTSLDILAVRSGSSHRIIRIEDEKIDTKNLHGTGCTFSAAVAAFLANSYDLEEAVRDSKAYLIGALIDSNKHKLGHGIDPINHFYDLWDARPFSDKIWNDIVPIYSKILQHPFILGLWKGTLDSDMFSFYIQQDFKFLQERSVALKKAEVKLRELVKSSSLITDDDIEYLAYVAHLTADQITEKKIFERYDIPSKWRDLDYISSGTRAYIKFMQRNMERPIEELLACLLPCSWLYQELGEHIDHTSHDAKYQKWISSYSSIERRKRINKFISILDRVAAMASPTQRIAMKRVFKEGMILEKDFWQSTFTDYSMFV